jgi:ketosteroid isomerase-like protein
MSLLSSIGRALRRAVALVLLGLFRARRVLVAVAAVAVVAYATMLVAAPSRLPDALRPRPGGTPASAVQSARGASPAQGGAASGPTTAGSPEREIQQVIARADLEQAQAIATGDPSIMRDTASDAYFQLSVAGNQALVQGGVKRIQLLNITWGPITVSGDIATAVAVETWNTEYADGRTEQSSDRNVYGLLRENGVWRIHSDEHPDAVAAAQ